MSSSPPAHEKLFDEICNKLNELSCARPEEESVSNQDKMDRLQTQIRKFQNDLQDTQLELRDKIKLLENVQVVQNSDMHQQLRVLTEQLNNERAVNTKLNSDLAKSLELGLQLQLEIQNLKAKAQHAQHEERKLSQTLQEKIRLLAHDLELARALRDETETELAKARAKFHGEHETWNQERLDIEVRFKAAEVEKADLLRANNDLLTALKQKDADIASLNSEMEKLSSSINDLEGSSLNQLEAMKSLASVAENKIVELKVALDRKTAECRDFEGHLQQAITQSQLLRQENGSLKDYIAKINVYLQSTSVSPASPPMAGAPAPAPNA